MTRPYSNENDAAANEVRAPHALRVRRLAAAERPRTGFWMQGETDGANALHAAAYEANLRTFISRLREDPRRRPRCRLCSDALGHRRREVTDIKVSSARLKWRWRVAGRQPRGSILTICRATPTAFISWPAE